MHHKYQNCEYWLDDQNQFHNENGAAFISSHLTAYYIHGKLHNDSGPAIIHSNGSLEFWIGGQLSATMHKGKEWNIWRNSFGQLHRENGPAIERLNGCVQSYYLNGFFIKTEDKCKLI